MIDYDLLHKFRKRREFVQSLLVCREEGAFSQNLEWIDIESVIAGIIQCLRTCVHMP